MSDTPGTWYHCTRCGSLFKAAADPGQRGACPACGEDPSGAVSHEAPPPARVRRKIRKKQARAATRGGDRKKARSLMIFVIGWLFLLGIGAIAMKQRWQQAPPSNDPPGLSQQALDDQRFVQEHLPACATRLSEFLDASDVGGRALHVAGASRTVARMARVQQFDPANPSKAKLEIEEYGVIHTPAGRAIETLWKQEGGARIEAVFFQEDGEWKIDWDAFARAGTESWPLFLAGRGDGEGEFRLLARERLGADGRDEEFIGLVLYSARNGAPGEAAAPSPEVKVERNSPMGRQIEAAFAARKDEKGPFGSRMVKHDPDDMIRLRARIRREGADERVFHLDELFACHWLELAAPSGAAE